MTDLSRLCPVCFNEKDNENNCPVCRGEKGLKQASPILPLRTTLENKYFIGKALKKNSEGITYSAFDIRKNRACSVRELFPDALANRDADEQTVIAAPGCEEDLNSCKAAFFGLWTKLYRLKGLTALINVTEVFATNGTVYAVYEESERVTLRDYLLEMPGGSISWDKARILLMPVLSTLGTLHTSGIIHRGINPESFIFSAEGKLKLTDFCIEQARTAAGDLNAELFDGYAALEQYATTGQMGTWTDIYAFSAVICRVLIGTTPIDAKTRAQNDRMMIPAQYAEKLPPYVINAIINGMVLAPAQRTRTVEQLRSNLSASPKAVNASATVYGSHPVGSAYSSGIKPVQMRPATSPAPQNRPSPVERVERIEIAPSEEKKKPKGKTGVIVLLCIIVVILVGFICFLLFNLFSGKGLNIGKETATEISEETSSEKVEVPRFVNLTAEEVLNDEEYNSEFTFITVEEFSSTVEKGYIIRQSEAAKSEVDVGTEITLTVSAGKKSFVIPDYELSPYEQIAALLQQEGLTVIKEFKYNDSPEKANLVAETIPPAGSTVYEGEIVRVVVWQDVEETTVPSYGYEYTTQEETTGNEVMNSFGELFE